MHYKNLFYMAALSFVSMYILMYIMVDSFLNVYANLNQCYMAALMTIPMVIIELFLMQSMYTNKKFNVFIGAGSFILFTVLLVFIRKQTGIYDKEFLKSMIPHHAAALLMCKEAHLQDPEVKQLCEAIRKSQQTEIDFMKTKLQAMK